MQVVIIIYKMNLANQRSNALKPCWLYNSYRADSSGLIDLENKNHIFFLQFALVSSVLYKSYRE